MKTNLIYQSLWDAAEAIPRGNFIVVSAYIKKRSQIHNLTLHFEGTKKNKLNPNFEGKK